MLIYEGKKGNGTRALFGTKNAVPDLGVDDEVLVNDETFDFTPGKYFYMPPGGIKDNLGNEVIVSLDGEQIIPPVWSDMGAVDPDYDTIGELVEVDDNDTPDDTSDDRDVLKKVWKKSELEAETKATIAEMADLLGYDGIDVSMTKSAMIDAFLEAQDADPRKPSDDNGGGQ